MRRKRTSRWPSRSPKRFPARMATTSTAGTWYVHLRHVPCRHVAPTHPTCPGAPQALARPGNINSGPVIVHQSGRSALHDIVRKCNSRSANLAQNEYYGRFLGSKHHAMRQRHAISPGFSVHYQDLGISSEEGVILCRSPEISVVGGHGSSPANPARLLYALL